MDMQNFPRRETFKNFLETTLLLPEEDFEKTIEVVIERIPWNKLFIREWNYLQEKRLSENDPEIKKRLLFVQNLFYKHIENIRKCEISQPVVFIS